MKKLVLISVIILLYTMSTFSQGRDRYSAFHLGIIPKFSSNGLYADEFTNAVSFNLFIGESYNEKAFTFGSIGNIIHNNATGLQFAGLFNHIGNRTRGVQFAGLSNYVGGSGKGIIFAGLSNVVREQHNGIQFGGLTNLIRDARGLQFAGLINYTDYFSGVQFAGLFNRTRAGSGVQLAGLANFGGDMRGVQFAGLVNVARSSTVPIALVNIISDGEMGVSVTYNELGSTIADFRSGSRVSYGILGVGYNHKADEAVVKGGYGFHINCLSWLRLNNEFTAETVGAFSEDTPAFKLQYALLPSFRFLRHFEVFGGPGLNYLRSPDDSFRDIFPSSSIKHREKNGRFEYLYIGWQVGIQLFIK